MINKLTSGFICILVGTTLLPEIGHHIRFSGVEQKQEYHRQTYLEYVEERLAVEKKLKYA